MNLFSRHKNTVVLATVLLAQLLGLAVQVKRQTAEGPVRLIRYVAVSGLAPFERLLIYSGKTVRGVWANYLDLRSVRRENLRLKAESERMRLDRAREQEDARQARRIQALLGFKEQWIDATVAAQVIGTSGSENSRLLYLDKGTKDGIKADMPVITPDGVVGKVLTVYGDTAQVLMINDPTSGVGATLVNSRLQGIVKGSSTGEVQLNYIMGDEAVQPGEALVTSGGDRVFPKGLPLGTVGKVSMGRNLFLDIKVQPATDLDRLEEVLVITEQKARTPDTAGLGPIRASDILAQHLPGVPQTPTTPSSPQQTPQQTRPATPQQGTTGATNGHSAGVASVPRQGAAQSAAQSALQGTLASKPQTQTVKPPTAKPAATQSGNQAIPKPSVVKPVAPKAVSPKAGGANPASAVSPAASEGKHPQ
jgi:rod shape-determining protein MreC